MKSGLLRLRRKLKFLFDLGVSDKLKVNLLQAFPFWIASLVTGLVAVAFARLFSYSEYLSELIFTTHPWLIFLLAPICFFLSWLIVRIFAVNAKGSGIPQVMAAIEMTTPRHNYRIDKLLSLRIIAVKVASSLVMVFGGGAIGREGPMIQIAGSIFRTINNRIPESWPKLSRQSFILTGAAAGLAAAFNTPLGGVVFAMEELSRIHIRFFRTPLFTAVIIAGLTAQGLLGPYLYLGYPDITNPKFSILVGVAVTAIIAGLCGSVMSKLILKVIKWRSSFKKSSTTILQIIGGALIVAVMAYFISGKILGSGKGLMATVLFSNNKHEEWYTPLLRIMGIVISFSTGSAGGVFAPSLSAGASIGAWIAGLFNVLGSNANILILSGMVAFLTGVTRTPFTSAILVLEMTDRHSIIFDLLLAALVANLISMVIDKHSLYDHLKKEYMEPLHYPRRDELISEGVPES